MKCKLLRCGLLGITITLALAGCNSQEQAAAITIGADAVPCYNAIKASTSAASTTTNVLNGATVVASDPACAAIDTATAGLIANAVNTNTPVVATPAQ